MSHSENIMQAVVFRVASELYAVSTHAAREVIPFEAPRRLPGAAEHVLGVLNIRGEIIPVADVMLALGLPPVANRRQIIVCDIDDGSMGIVVESVESITNISPGDITQPEALSHPALSGVVTSDAGLIVVMDVYQALRAEHHHSRVRLVQETDGTAQMREEAA